MDGPAGEAGEQDIPNDSWGGFTRFLKAIGEELEVLALVITVVAIVVVAVVFLTNPAGWAALATAFAFAGPLFTAASVLGGIAVGTKVTRWALGDSTVSVSGLLLDLGLMALGLIAGKLGKLGKAAGQADDLVTDSRVALRGGGRRDPTAARRNVCVPCLGRGTGHARYLYRNG